MMTSQTSAPLVVWWRFGKEHETLETTGTLSTITRYPAEVVQTHIQAKLERLRQTPPESWRWHVVDDDLIIERDVPPYLRFGGADTRFYYLLKRGLAVVENFHGRRGTFWYIHVCDFLHNADENYWIMKDLFTDILVQQDGSRYRLVDLDDLAHALDIGLIDAPTSSMILRRTQDALYSIERDGFPFAEVRRGREVFRLLGWMNGHSGEDMA